MVTHAIGTLGDIDFKKAGQQTRAFVQCLLRESGLTKSGSSSTMSMVPMPPDMIKEAQQSQKISQRIDMNIATLPSWGSDTNAT